VGTFVVVADTVAVALFAFSLMRHVLLAASHPHPLAASHRAGFAKEQFKANEDAVVVATITVESVPSSKEMGEATVDEDATVALVQDCSSPSAAVSHSHPLALLQGLDVAKVSQSTAAAADLPCATVTTITAQVTSDCCRAPCRANMVRLRGSTHPFLPFLSAPQSRSNVWL
jgi:hypothetical protein